MKKFIFISVLMLMLLFAFNINAITAVSPTTFAYADTTVLSAPQVADVFFEDVSFFDYAQDDMILAQDDMVLSRIANQLKPEKNLTSGFMNHQIVTYYKIKNKFTSGVVNHSKRE